MCIALYTHFYLYAAMGNHVALLLVFMFMLLIKDGLTLKWGHTIWHNKIEIVSNSLECGIKSGDEHWQAQFNVTYIDEDNDNIWFTKTILIQTVDLDEICTLDYSDNGACFSSIESIPTTLGCFCSKSTNVGNTTYIFKVKQKAIAALSSKKVGVSIARIGSIYSESRHLGYLPLMYDPVSTSCTLDESPVSLEPSSNNQIDDSTSATVECCANNLITPYKVKISINDTVVSLATDTPCVSTTNTYDFVALSSYKVNFKYEEDSDNCSRTDADNLKFFITSGSTSGSGYTSDSKTVGLVGGLVGAIMFVVIGQFLV